MDIELVPQQRVIIDDTIIATYVGPAPNSPGKVIVESFGVGPVVIDGWRVKSCSEK